MANDLIKPGVAVLTRLGRVAGVIDSVTRHPLTRRVVAVIIRPEGVDVRDDFLVTSARNLRPIAA